MHNLHFIVLHANSGAEACERAENLISDYGNENNWRQISGAVSESNSVYTTGNGRFQPDADMTIEECNKYLSVWLSDEGFGRIAADKFRNGEADVFAWDEYELWSLKHLAEYLRQTKGWGGSAIGIDVLQQNFYYYQFDHEGVTQMDDYQHEGGERWVVFVDMHS